MKKKTDKNLDCLTDNERNALAELKGKILEKYPGAEVILYGSKARGDYNRDSDIDLLILLDAGINSKVEDIIYGKALLNINKKYPGSVFSLLIENKKDWEHYKGNPFLKENIIKEGLHI
jgi:hypothetical protein